MSNPSSDTAIEINVLDIKLEKGEKHRFEGDDLTSPTQQAILFLNELAKKEELF